MRIGARVDFALAFIAWGVLAGMLITLYERFGGWAILAFIGPTLLGRQVLERSQESIDSSRAYRSREAALTQLSRQIDQERADERRLIAADLHDDVLQPLFKVTLLSQVLRSELAGESSDVVKDDIFELHEASQIAADEVRNLIGDLRRPGLGRAGLTAALRRLTQVFQERAPLSIHPSLLNLELEDTGRQLAIYQVAKEALTNAIHHSGALNVWVELSGTEELVVLLVRDDGKGFDPYFEREGHYGMHIMRERVAAVGGSLYVDSEPGRGSCVTASFPAST